MQVIIKYHERTKEEKNAYERRRYHRNKEKISQRRKELYAERKQKQAQELNTHLNE